MTASTLLTRSWRSAQRLSDRTPLRVKLITAVFALVLIALAVISAASVAIYHNYLNGQADVQLREQFRLEMVRVKYLGGLPENQLFIGGPNLTVLRAQGQQLNASVQFAPGVPQTIAVPDVPVSSAWVSAHAGQLVTVSGLNSTDKWRVIVEPVKYNNLGTIRTDTLIVGTDLGNISGAIGRLTSIELIVGAVILAVLAVVGVAIVRASMRPLDEIEETAVAIAAGDLTRRVPDRDPRTEVGRLGHSLNTMLEQIESAFRARAASETAARRSEERMRQFVADASHELRTPLTTIRGYAEYYRQRGGIAGTEPPALAAAEPAAGDTTSGNGLADNAAGNGQPNHGAEPGVFDPTAGPLSHVELDKLIERLEREAARMGILVDDMLLLARLDEQRPIEIRTVDLLSIAAEAVGDARVIAPDRAITLTVDTSTAPLVLGDEVRLRQVVGNLIGNALTHTPARTPVEVTIRSGQLGDDSPGNAVILDVTDHGPGLSGDQIEHVFERFYRTDRARTRTAGGTGLGLAIVAALISAHHGRVWVDSRPGQGASFSFALPLAPEALAAEANHADPA